MKKILLTAMIAGAIVTLGLAGWLIIAGRDIPPPDVSDIAVNYVSIPPENNGFTLFLAATNSFFWPTNKTLAIDYLDGKPSDESVIQDIITRNEETLRLLDEGIARGVCITPEVTDINTPLPYLSPLRNMGRLLAVKSRFERLSGKCEPATETCVALLSFGNLIQRDAGCLIDYLVGISVLNMGIEETLEITRDSATSADQFSQLLRALESLTPVERGLIHVTRVEYRCMSKIIDDLERGKYGVNEVLWLGDGKPERPVMCNRMLGYLFQPNRTKLMFADVYRGMIANAGRTFANMKPLDEEASIGFKISGAKLLLHPNAVGKVLCAILLPSLDKVIEGKYRTECGINAARIIAALNAHRKREGDLPDDLQALVPEYLPSVPIDPFDGKPFRYSASKGIVYSVGRDLVDSGGSTNLPAGETCSDQASQRWEAEDAVFEIHDPSIKAGAI